MKLLLIFVVLLTAFVINFSHTVEAKRPPLGKYIVLDLAYLMAPIYVKQSKLIIKSHWHILQYSEINTGSSLTSNLHPGVLAISYKRERERQRNSTIAYLDADKDRTAKISLFSHAKNDIEFTLLNHLSYMRFCLIKLRIHNHLLNIT